MKIIEFYGYSRSGKSFEAQKLNNNFEYNDYFLKIANQKRFKRILIKIFFLRFVRIKDIIFILNLHKIFFHENLIKKIKNFFSFMYLISFIRSNRKSKKVILIDHGIFQCLFSSYLNSKNSPDLKNLSNFINKFLNDLNLDFYKIIEIKTNFSIIKKRLKSTKNFVNLNYLENNEKKVLSTYFYLSELQNLINNENIIFEKK